MVSMRNDVLNVALDPTDNPYLMGPYAPVDTEIEAPDLRVIGEIPDDLNGLYVRNGPNPQHAPAGRYHWFDGDGMLHALHFRDGTASYRNRWVRTVGFQRESQAGAGPLHGDGGALGRQPPGREAAIPLPVVEGHRQHRRRVPQRQPDGPLVPGR